MTDVVLKMDWKNHIFGWRSRYKRILPKWTIEAFKFFIWLTVFIIGRVATIALSSYGWRVMWFGAEFWALIFPTCNASWIVVEVFPDVPVRLTCAALRRNFRRVWFFNYYFCVKKKLKLVYVQVVGSFFNINKKKGQGWFI